MPKAYWIAFYREVKDPDKFAAYAKLAGPAISAGGGRVLARGEPARVYEHGLKSVPCCSNSTVSSRLLPLTTAPLTKPHWLHWATVPNAKSA